MRRNVNNLSLLDYIALPRLLGSGRFLLKVNSSTAKPIPDAYTLFVLICSTVFRSLQ